MTCEKVSRAGIHLDSIVNQYVSLGTERQRKGGDMRLPGPNEPLGDVFGVVQRQDGRLAMPAC